MKIITVIRQNPIRAYAVVSSALAIVSHYVPGAPVPLYLGLAATLLGVGEATNRSVKKNGSSE